MLYLVAVSVFVLLTAVQQSVEGSLSESRSIFIFSKDCFQEENGASITLRNN